MSSKLLIDGEYFKISSLHALSKYEPFIHGHLAKQVIGVAVEAFHNGIFLSDQV